MYDDRVEIRPDTCSVVAGTRMNGEYQRGTLPLTMRIFQVLITCKGVVFCKQDNSI